ncbi:hypothetical protein VI817_009966 [Penicillium citrinum]|nr:hypothetical protein VI817_009966 [Penicillium citrinum]
MADGLLTYSQFPKQIRKKEAQQLIKDAKVLSQESMSIIDWQAWSTNKVASKASVVLSACPGK